MADGLVRSYANETRINYQWISGVWNIILDYYYIK